MLVSDSSSCILLFVHSQVFTSLLSRSDGKSGRTRTATLMDCSPVALLLFGVLVPVLGAVTAVPRDGVILTVLVCSLPPLLLDRLLFSGLTGAATTAAVGLVIVIGGGSCATGKSNFTECVIMPAEFGALVPVFAGVIVGRVVLCVADAGVPIFESDSDSLGVANAGLGALEPNGCCDRIVMLGEAIITGLVLSFGFLPPLSLAFEGVVDCTAGDGKFMLGDVIITGRVFNFRLLSDPLLVGVDTSGVDGDGDGKVVLVDVANAGLVFTFRVLSTPLTVSFFVSGEPNEGLTARPVFICQFDSKWRGLVRSCNAFSDACCWMLGVQSVSALSASIIIGIPNVICWQFYANTKYMFGNLKLDTSQHLLDWGRVHIACSSFLDIPHHSCSVFLCAIWRLLKLRWRR